MNSELVFDVGLHNGDDTAYYLHKGYRVVAVDANLAMIEKARTRFAAALSEKRLTLVHAAIAQERGKIEFWVNREWSELSSVHREFSSRRNQPLEQVTVPAIQFGDLLEKHGVPFYLKIDIEGNDHLCLKALNKGDLPAFCSWEAGGLDFLYLTRELGFDAFRCVDQTTLGQLSAPLTGAVKRANAWNKLYHSHALPARVARKLMGRPFILRRAQALRWDGDWPFPMGCSGTFGPHFPGKWTTLEECAAAWLHTYLPHELNPKRDSFPWTDFHAARSASVPMDLCSAGLAIARGSRM